MEQKRKTRIIALITVILTIVAIIAIILIVQTIKLHKLENTASKLNSETTYYSSEVERQDREIAYRENPTYPDDYAMQESGYGHDDDVLIR